MVDLSPLLNPSNYHQLPAPDQPFLPPSKAIPGDTPLEKLLAEGHHRLAAEAAITILTDSEKTSPSDHETIFALLYVRLATLTLLSFTVLAVAEAAPLLTLLFDSSTMQVLSPPLPEQRQQQYRRRSSHAAVTLVPWELRVLAIRLLALSSDNWRRALMSYYELAREARANISATVTTSHGIIAKKDGDAFLWRSRLHDLGVRVANALIEIGDLEAAAVHLASLEPVPENNSEAGSIGNDGMRLREALVWLSLGNVRAAEKCLERTSSIVSNSDDASTARDMLVAMLEIADGNFTAAHGSWEVLSSKRKKNMGDVISPSPLVDQNRAICSLYAGNMKDVCSRSSSYRYSFPLKLQ